MVFSSAAMLRFLLRYDKDAVGHVTLSSVYSYFGTNCEKKDCLLYFRLSGTIISLAAPPGSHFTELIFRLCQSWEKLYNFKHLKSRCFSVLTLLLDFNKHIHCVLEFFFGQNTLYASITLLQKAIINKIFFHVKEKRFDIFIHNIILNYAQSEWLTQT